MRALLIRLLFFPTLAWNLLLHRLFPARRWWDRVDERVLLGALPFASDVPALKAAGVGAVVNLCAEYSGPEKAYARAGIVQLRLPTLDFTPPRQEDIARAVQFISNETARGVSVYVHCKAGRGRGAMVALCWLAAARGLSPEEAQARLQQHRPHVLSDLHRREVVREFLDGKERGTRNKEQAG